MCKQHLNAFSVMARSLECFSLGERASNVTGFLVDATLQPAERRLWAALRLQRAATAVAHAGPIKKCLAVVDQPARRRESLASWGLQGFLLTGRLDCDVLQHISIYTKHCPEGIHVGSEAQMGDAARRGEGGLGCRLHRRPR